MNDFLKVKTAGLPRWAWALMLTGAVGVGLYLRSRPSNSTEEAPGEGEASAYYRESSGGEGGLGVAGLVSTPPGQITPVEAPYIPEGFVDMFAALTNLAGELGATIGNIKEIERENPGGGGLTGGGAPETPTEHFTPPPAPPPPPPSQPAACATGTVNHIRDLRNERARLQGEIDQLQGKIANLTNLLQTYPKANGRSTWEAERNQARGAIDFKRNRVNEINAAIERARSQPGCANA